MKLIARRDPGYDIRSQVFGWNTCRGFGVTVFIRGRAWYFRIRTVSGLKLRDRISFKALW